MVSKAYHLKDSVSFVEKALHWASGFDSVCFLNSNGYRDNYGNINVFIAVGEQDCFVAENNKTEKFGGKSGAESDPLTEGENTGDPTSSQTFSRLQAFIDQYPNRWIPGFLGYDLKNELEDLHTRHPNRTGLPDAYFFVPTFTLLVGQFNVEVRADDPDLVIRQIESTAVPSECAVNFDGTIQHRMSKEAYLSAFDRVQKHLYQGDCYEINLCQEFYAENTNLDPLSAYKRLNEISPTPFSCFFKRGEQYILSASPERFISKQGNTVISQPIKGTAPRGMNPEEDERIKQQLLNNPKERSENVMIVDLVRNDLTKCAKPGTVKTTELAKAYSFKQVHQLISTIQCELAPNTPLTQVIAAAFPPGSMTGAPKVSAMEIIDQCEQSRRGVYSGGLGYFGPQGNFDFSVVIRTIVYNKENKYLSFQTGGAITALSDAASEYKECLLKGKAIFEILSDSQKD